MRDFWIILVVWSALFVTFSQQAAIVNGSTNDTSTPKLFLGSTSLVSESLENQSLTDNATVQNETSQLERTTFTDNHTLPEWAKAELEAPLSDTQSCKQKCGKIDLSYCSCDLRCLVHKNCCEDMEIACPEVLEESRLRYGHMLDMTVECPRENVFLITECGKARSISTSIHANKENMENTGNKLESSSRREPSKPWNQSISPNTTPPQLVNKEHDITIKDILDAMKDPYVTDTTTSFVYKNMEIFSCAALNNSNPVTWEVSLSGDQMTEVKSLEELLLNAKGLIYSPPENPLYSIESEVCSFGSIGTCQEKYLMSSKDLLHRCQQFISYVFAKDALIYNNRYCKVCNNFTEEELQGLLTLTTRNKFRFSLTMTLSGNSLKVTANKKINGFPVYWDSASCQLSETSPTEMNVDGGTCVSRCSEKSVKKHDGVCWGLDTVIFAISDDDYPLTVNEINVFPVFARCFLEVNPEIKFVNEFSPTFIMFDAELNISLYATQSFVYQKTHFLLVENELAQKLSLMAKTFKAFRRSKSSSPRDLLNKDNTFSYLRPIFFYSVAFYLSVAGDPPKSVTHSDDKIVLCFWSGSYTPINQPVETNKVVSCVSAPLFEGDQEAISFYLNSTCFSVFDLHNSGKTSLSSPTFFYISVISSCLTGLTVSWLVSE